MCPIEAVFRGEHLLMAEVRWYGYVCPTCYDLLREAVQQMCCGHRLCECCAEELSKEVTPQCTRKDYLQQWKSGTTEEPQVILNN